MSRATTGIGSLPQRDPAGAADFVLATADVPYLPELPGVEPFDALRGPWGEGVCRCGAVEPGGSRREASREDPFAGAAALLARLPLDTPAVKTQATGPITAAASLRAAGHPTAGLWDCVVEGLVRKLTEHVLWVRTRLPATEVTLIIDEPALAAIDSTGNEDGAHEALAVLGEVLGAAPVAAGIHCCGSADWGRIAVLRPAAVSLDVAALGPRFGEGAAALAEAVSEGCRMIWGAVPVEPPPLPPTDVLVGRVRRAEGMLVMAGADIRRLDAAWVTPACGMAGLVPDHAAAVAERVAEVAEHLGG